MCGIAGIVYSKEIEKRKTIVEKMLRSIVYRGPDESGIYHSAEATIGCVRLSIIDIDGGKQPLPDSSGRYWIAYNGEIFNYIELREILLEKGFKFRTHSDTEVLVQLYSLYGPDSFSMLNGQFAAAIWDCKNEELVLVRDRVGIRPLFYYLKDGSLSFASEAKALFEVPFISPEISFKSLKQIYTLWTTITPNTVFKNIYEIPPGCYLKIGKTGDYEIHRYFELAFEENMCRYSLNDALDRFYELLTDAVKIRLRSDVKVAAYLSGGLDSSTMVAFIKEIDPRILNTFSIGFEENGFDESKYQDEAVRYFNTSHSSIRISSKDIVDSFQKVVWHSEMPLLRTAPAPMLLLSELANSCGIKVIITGEGADELLAGYDIFKETAVRIFWASEPESKLRPMLLKRLYPYLPLINNANLFMLKTFFGFRLAETSNPFYSHLIRWNNNSRLANYLLSPDALEIDHYDPVSEIEEHLPEKFQSWNWLSKAQWLETTIFMSGYLLSSQGDRMSMANSVEGRYPFLDYRIIDFCSNLPSGLKLKGLNEKYLLKKLMNKRLPETILKRYKQPYRAPVSKLFISEDATEYYKYVLSDNYLRHTGIFNPDSISKFLKKVRTATVLTELESMFLTAVVSTQVLFDQYIDKNSFNTANYKMNDFHIIEDFQT
jgi:asparagine synthase (glutamine-hydrolysing)